MVMPSKPSLGIGFGHSGSTSKMGASTIASCAVAVNCNIDTPAQRHTTLAVSTAALTKLRCRKSLLMTPPLSFDWSEQKTSPTHRLRDLVSTQHEEPYCSSAKRTAIVTQTLARHQLRRTNSRPSSFFAQSTIGVLLRKLVTAGSIVAGSPSAKVASATTTSHSSLNATESRPTPVCPSGAQYGRRRPSIQPTSIGLLRPRGWVFGFTRSVSLTRSSSVSSETPVAQLQ